MKVLILVLSILILKNQTAYADMHYLAIGESRILDNSKLLDVYLSNSKVLKVKDLNTGKLLVKAASLGTAKLSIGTTDYSYQVISKPTYQRLMELKKQIKNCFGISIEVVESCPVIRGKLLKISDWQKISSLDFGKKIPNCALPYQMKASISEDIPPRDLNKLLKENQSDFLKIVLDAKRMARLLYSPQFKKVAQNLAKQLGIEIERDLNQKNESTYHFELIAVKDSELKQYGIGLPTSANYNFAEGFETGNINGKISSLYNAGKYTHLQGIRISTLDDQSSKFHSGGEVPVKLVGERNSQITWKAYGFLLEVQTTQRNWREEKIKLQVTASNLDSANSIDGIPAIQKQSYSGSFVIADEIQILFNFRNLGQTDSSQSNFGIHWIPFIKDLFSENQIRMEDHHLIMIYKPANTIIQNDLGDKNE
ncbi:MAG: hypothetical protein VX642_06055 [Bdellovibrionota bacterium]|nr:hypothetical protein [Bdellovibrionota bacterium]